MFYIYEKSSTYIMGYKNGKVRPDHRKSYKTQASARAALTRWSHQWWREEGINGDSADKILTSVMASQGPTTSMTILRRVVQCTRLWIRLKRSQSLSV